MIRGSMFGQEAVFLASKFEPLLVISLHPSPCGLPEPQAEAALWSSWQQHSFMAQARWMSLLAYGIGAMMIWLMGTFERFGWLICREKCEYG
ncbi:hypothetical protein HOY82DRAFT_480726 [Tuber indicum]|nr:hypothetical protein HOY82DRAFT_480726 [Tuber indicum]